MKKQVDENWYQGETMVCSADGSTSTQIGFFPASYVQVIHPLPASIPQCKALYDFDLKDENEKDCLSFNKVRLDFRVFAYPSIRCVQISEYVLVEAVFAFHVLRGTSEEQT